MSDRKEAIGPGGVNPDGRAGAYALEAVWATVAADMARVGLG